MAAASAANVLPSAAARAGGAIAGISVARGSAAGTTGRRKGMHSSASSVRGYTDTAAHDSWCLSLGYPAVHGLLLQCTSQKQHKQAVVAASHSYTHCPLPTLFKYRRGARLCAQTCTHAS